MERMLKARVGLITAQPFFGTLAMQIDLVEDPKVKSSRINGRTLRFNPQVAADLPMPQLEAMLAHQVMSCALGHHLRRGGRDNKVWQQASDIVVNDELTKAGFTLPDGSLRDPRFTGSYAEAVYAALKEIEEQQDDPSGGKGKNDPAPGGQSQAGSSKGKPGKGEQPAPSDGTPEQGQGGEPSIPGEDATGSVDDACDEDGKPADAAEIAEQEESWRVAVAQAAQAARGAGKLPGNIERALDSVLKPRVAWQEALQRYFRSKAKNDFSWAKPNRRYIQQGIYLPSLSSTHIGAIALAFDLSGSITQVIVDQFVAEIEDIRASVNPEEVIVLLFDTKVREIIRIQAGEELSIKVAAGGGTAFDDPVRQLDELGVTPEVLVYLTDLDSSVFPPEPHYPVLWVSTKKTFAPFGDVIKID